MAATQLLKSRIKSVTNTRQLTRAMEMVASSKLRRAQQAVALPIAFRDASQLILSQLASAPEAKLIPYFGAAVTDMPLTIVVAGDQGLAGPYNGNIYKAFLEELGQDNKTQQIITVGKRPSSHLARFSNIHELAAYDIENKVSVEIIAKAIAGQALTAFDQGQVRTISLIYTRFESISRHTVQIERLLPQTSVGMAAYPQEVEAGIAATSALAVKSFLEASIACAIASARASELASRMLAMMNATDNANDLISDLTLAYNNARQGAITQEIAEITSGAEAITQ